MAHFTIENLACINEYLANTNYLNGDLPGADDVRIFNALKGVPPKNQFPEIYFWYLLLNSFTPAIRAQWVTVASPKRQEQKKEKPKKQEPKKTVDEDIDLFGNNDDPEIEKKAKALAEQKQQEGLAKKNNKNLVGKTIVIFEVKIFEATDQALLEQIAKRIKDTINPDGLVWGKDINYEEIAYGAKKIVMSMVIEDKIFTEDIFDQITAWEDEVSSVDIVTMQKG
ncbi:unnamed protein product [Paramecium pentaurelia]|uniref:Translation elongation factor EF1B beta/delta subunit guanine nucleotide exchange domain-containing protein n=1 Tax=Paramecium pentaurelia TaxID=43138 RepID=A0A8S1WN60_9CILI|nr:unnamed protein product [Paramecium pentaurelia]